MSNGHTAILGNHREFAHRMVDSAPRGAVLTIKPPKRSLDQNAKLHAMISEISAAKPQGRVLPVHVWKQLFMAMCGHKVRFEPALDGEGVVPVGFRTSGLSKTEFSELIECVACFAAENGVTIQDQAA